MRSLDKLERIEFYNKQIEKGLDAINYYKTHEEFTPKIKQMGIQMWRNKINEYQKTLNALMS